MPATLFVSVLIIRPPPRPTLFPYTTLFRSLRNRDRALIERLKLKRAKRPVPDEGSCVLQQARDGVDRLRTDVQDHIVGAHVIDVANMRRCMRFEFLRDGRVNGKHDAASSGRSLFENGAGGLEE